MRHFTALDDRDWLAERKAEFANDVLSVRIILALLPIQPFDAVEPVAR